MASTDQDPRSRSMNTLCHIEVVYCKNEQAPESIGLYTNDTSVYNLFYRFSNYGTLVHDSNVQVARVMQI